jgi:hypothetical protein
MLARIETSVQHRIAPLMQDFAGDLEHHIRIFQMIEVTDPVTREGPLYDADLE